MSSGMFSVLALCHGAWCKFTFANSANLVYRLKDYKGVPYDGKCAFFGDQKGIKYLDHFTISYMYSFKDFSPPSCIWMVYRRGSWRYAFLSEDHDLLAFAVIYGECNLIRVNLHRQGYLLLCSPDVSGSMIGGSKPISRALQRALCWRLAKCPFRVGCLQRGCDVDVGSNTATVIKCGLQVWDFLAFLVSASDSECGVH
jgi:hypothetical protein